MIILDTSGLLAALDPGQVDHSTAKQALQAARPPRLLSPFVLAELDYLITKHAGSGASRALLQEVADGAYSLVGFDSTQIAGCLRLMNSIRHLEIGLADASVWSLALRFNCNNILTLDQRHFRHFSTVDGQPFRLLPADFDPGSA